MEEFIIYRINTFLRAFITWYEFIIKCSVYLNIIMSLHNVLLRHCFSCVFEKLARFDVFRVYYGTGQYRLFELSNAVLISRHRSPALYPVSTCTNLLRTESFKLSSRVIRISDCLLLIDNCGRLTWLWFFRDSIKLSQCCSHAWNFSRVFNRAACATKSRFVCSLLKYTLFHSLSTKNFREN